VEPPVISIVGWHNVGKTTFVEALLRELKRQGVRVATLKHTHGEFQLDHEGTDSWRYAQAGSDCVVLAGHERAAFIARTEHELGLDELLARLPCEVDLAVTEGFKQEPTQKIEILAAGETTERVAAAGPLIAIVAERPPADVLASGVPCFAPTDAAGVVRLLRALGLLSQTPGDPVAWP